VRCNKEMQKKSGAATAPDVQNARKRINVATNLKPTHATRRGGFLLYCSPWRELKQTKGETALAALCAGAAAR